ncbi:MAG: pilus assembly protein PilY [Burkholderiales bacterium]|nr:pilus assembly protein PilY [Burkholderiales bacterium]
MKPWVHARSDASRFSLLRGVVATVLALAAAGAQAALTSVADAPLFTSSGSAVKPNLMFILDDSGSMDWKYLPDDVGKFGSSQYGLYAAQCNGLAYNPARKYQVPVDANGVPQSPGDVTALWRPSAHATNPNSLASPTTLTTVASAGLKMVVSSGSGSKASYSSGDAVVFYSIGDDANYMLATVSSYDSKTRALSATVTSVVGMTGTVLSSPLVGSGAPPFYYTYSGSQPAMGYSYTATSVITTSTFYKECSSKVGSNPGAGVFTKVIVSSAMPDAQNYANWQTYYDTRMEMVKTAISLVFSPLDDRYRVGLTTISKTSGVTLDIDTFGATQKSLFYSALSHSAPSGSTPLRGALSNVGRYFANKMPGQVADPVQYSCQKNFAILSTDGYWNTGMETSTYGPLDLFGQPVGQQDAAPTPRPMQDGPGTSASSNSLADVAMYYYDTDLRTPALGNCTGALGTSVCPAAGATVTSIRNMTTFTMGLGVSGTLAYAPDYLTQTSGDYLNLIQGTRNWPAPTGGATNVDDLWHAAVNGRGRYFSARDPEEVIQGLNTALLEINKETGAGSAAATSTLEPVAGNNAVYVAKFTSGFWTGNLLSYSIDPASGKISSTDAWSGGAAGALDARLAAAKSPRRLYFQQAGALTAFNYANLQAAGLNGYFDGFCNMLGAGGSARPDQCFTLSSTDLAAANSGANLVAWLAGSHFGYYRERASALGDIVDAAPIFVGPPGFKYADAGYASFVSAQAQRAGAVYVGANDGMLHAFDAATGSENWAFFPSAVLPRLYKLADQSYPRNHAYYVDGPLRMGDILADGVWKTILVGGLGGGGRSYFALDITDPQSPKLLWEFSHPNLGLSFGNPVITKRRDGTWVVVFASGYNNTEGDGNGHLFVLDANTGAQLIDAVPTYTAGTMPAGSVGTPSGLAKINAWVSSEVDNTATAFYGGDLLGNLWRFDIDQFTQPYGQAMRLASLQAGGLPQPITTKPMLAEMTYMGQPYQVVYVATGQYLGTPDLATTGQQSIYAIKDSLASSGLGDVRAGNTLVQQKFSDAAVQGGGAIRLATSNPVDWSSKNGWYVDFLSSGERTNVDLALTLNVLSVVSNVPSTDACDAGGKSWLYHLDIGTGTAPANAPDRAAGLYLGDVMSVGQTVVQLPSNGQTVTITTESNGSLLTTSLPPPPVTGAVRRTSWRELVD